ncbi:hypothetical protein U8335_05630 [Roseiconus lacunae]|uniref:hypothetical protein n=1 Tax=Roseiconus lacunae TaxID=2605694 RepID=UPI003089F23C|nr:hypothetical protein U8335_05630 [Stieleria sp. HD01]
MSSDDDGGCDGAVYASGLLINFAVLSVVGENGNRKHRRTYLYCDLKSSQNPPPTRRCGFNFSYPS